MRTEAERVAAIAAIRAYLSAEGLVLCRAPDTSFALDGERELGAVVGLVDAVADEWDEVTDVVPPGRLANLRAACSMPDV